MCSLDFHLPPSFLDLSLFDLLLFNFRFLIYGFSTFYTSVTCPYLMRKEDFAPFEAAAAKHWRMARGG
jgi:hypothetical protein